jgi:hypothetical protein
MGILHAAINGKSGSGTAFFFSGDHYITFDWTRETVDQGGSTFRGRAVGGPFPLTGRWSLPLNMQFSGFARSFDACLSGDAGGSPAFAGKMYFFRDADYARYDYSVPPVGTPDSAGAITAWNLTSAFAANVRGAFNGKRSRLGFAYFFKDANYVRYNWSNNTVDADYPKAISTLIGMPSHFFSGVEAAIDGDAAFADFGYLFKDDVYCRFNWNDVKVDNGPAKVWQNWPGVLELLLAAQARQVALAWLDDAITQLGFYIAQLNTGVPSPFDTGLMELALTTHFHLPVSMDAATRMSFLTKITAQLGAVRATLNDLANHLIFHDDGEVKVNDATYVEADGSPKYRAYTGLGGPITLTSRWVLMTDDQFTAAAVLIHEAVHLVDGMSTVERDSPEWYVTGTTPFSVKVSQPDGSVVDMVVPFYDTLTPDGATHNPSSYNAFSQHVSLGIDRRAGVEKRRAGY